MCCDVWRLYCERPSLVDYGRPRSAVKDAGMTPLAWSQLIALALAALYFAFKVLQGWLVVNVSLSGSVRRAKSSRNTGDLLGVEITVTKGPIGSVIVEQARVRASWDGGAQSIQLFDGHRLATTRDATGRSMLKEPWQVDAAGGRYRLPPGESAVWSCLLAVPAGVPVVVEAVVLGRQPPSRGAAQWRCSFVSLPE
jgi:hypothetical protein